MKHLYFVSLLFLTQSLIAQNFSFNYSTTGQRVCLVEAEVDLSTPSVIIKLLDAASNTNKTTSIFKRPLYSNGSSWLNVATNIPPGTTQWIDANINIGEEWEYQIKRSNSWSYASQSFDATGYTVANILKDNSVYQGQMILLVADNISTNLNAKYTRLKKELTGEGWFVNELIVPKASGWDSGSDVVGIRNQIISIYNNAPANDKPKALFILGHVPMPRSGSGNVTSPDGHNENKGARGCDGYYADIDGIYTDVATFNPGGLQTNLAINLPGDYKWDQDFFPSALEMAFGRVDFEDLTNTSTTELQNIENYLDRLSNYKNVTAGFYMGNKSGFYIGYDNSNDGSYRTLPNISKASDVYQNTTGTPHPQWVQSNGPFKVYMQNAGFPDAGEWTTYGMDATVFTSDQSYWGFNDVPQDFYYSRIRGLLSLNTKCLVTLWSTSAINSFYQTCTGDPLGFAVKETINHNTVNNNIEKPQQNWDTQDWWNRTHLSYNGDPTLRLYQLHPASNFSVTNITNNAQLSWSASPDANASGYHIYKSNSEFGIYTRITATSISGLNYTDPNYQPGEWYMLRAIKTEESGCGKFINPSIGIFAQSNNITKTKELNLTNSLHVFPNPSQNYVKVEAGTNINDIKILSVDGREVLKMNNINQFNTMINIEQLAEGLYLLEITIDNISITKKIIVE